MASNAGRSVVNPSWKKTVCGKATKETTYACSGRRESGKLWLKDLDRIHRGRSHGKHAGVTNTSQSSRSKVGLSNTLFTPHFSHLTLHASMTDVLSRCLPEFWGVTRRSGPKRLVILCLSCTALAQWVLPTKWQAHRGPQSCDEAVESAGGLRRLTEDATYLGGFRRSLPHSRRITGR